MSTAFLPTPPPYVSTRGWGCPRPRPARPGCCVRPDDPPDRPDVAIYSQDEQLAAGAEPTWDNPDILTNSWPPWALLAEPRVTVRNLSPTAAAVGVAVHFELSPFGIGMPRVRQSTQVTGLAPLQARTLGFPLAQATLQGPQLLGAHVVIELAVDARAINNRGSQVISGVFTSAVGRDFVLPFPVRNPRPTPDTITLAVMTNDLSAVVTPAARGYAPFEQVGAEIRLRVPPGLHGAPGADVPRAATVVARDGRGAVVGGVTFLVRVDT